MRAGSSWIGASLITAHISVTKNVSVVSHKARQQKETKARQLCRTISVSIMWYILETKWIFPQYRDPWCYQNLIHLVINLGEFQKTCMLKLPFKWANTKLVCNLSVVQLSSAESAICTCCIGTNNVKARKRLDITWMQTVSFCSN